jgi:N-acetylmuramoyl-L-alanine amidase
MGLDPFKEAVMMLLLVLQAMAAEPPKIITSETLKRGIHVVVDAGHGGLNPGARYQFTEGGKNRIFVEKIYTCDVAARVIMILIKSGIDMSTTTFGKCLDAPQEKLLENSSALKTEEFFSTTGKLVVGDSAGREERLMWMRSVANSSSLKVVAISIHIDKMPTSRRRGAYLIVPRGQGGSPLAMAIAQEFENAKRLLKFCKESAIVENGECGLRRLQILSRSPLDDTVLIEIANMSNREDLNWLRTHEGRQEVAEIIARGIMSYLLSFFPQSSVSDATFLYDKFGATSQDRTGDLRFTIPSLYRLS